VQRRDNVTRLLSAAVRTLFWFHPLVWYADHRLAVERERACDERVVEVTRDGHAYLNLLTKLSRFVLGHPEPAGVSCLHQSDIKERMQTIMNLRIINSRLASITAVSFAVVAVAGASIASAAMYQSTAGSAAPAAGAIVRPATKHYTGDPIELRLKDAKLKQLLGVFAQLTGKEIALDPSIDPDLLVSADFIDTPWDRALELILAQQHLSYVSVGGKITVTPTADTESRPFDIAFSVKKKDGHVYETRISITNRNTRQLLSAPTVSSVGGQAAEISTTIEGGYTAFVSGNI
jgi:hypothetical protein